MNDRHKMLGSGHLSKEFDRAESARITAERRAPALERLAAADAAFAQVKAMGAVPDICGPDIPVAPARGAYATFRPIRILPGSAGTAVPDGYRAHGEMRHRAAIRRADVFDVMEQDALRRHHKRGEDAGPFVPPFTPGQVAMARLYRDLVERYDGAGVKCSSLEQSFGGGDAASFMDAVADDGDALRRIRGRIGQGVALRVRRVRPSTRGDDRAGIIFDRVLVDHVCLGDMSLTDVLRTHGWAKSTKHLGIMRGALAAALDRMQGYRGSHSQDVG